MKLKKSFRFNKNMNLILMQSENDWIIISFIPNSTCQAFVTCYNRHNQMFRIHIATSNHHESCSQVSNELAFSEHMQGCVIYDTLTYVRRRFAAASAHTTHMPHLSEIAAYTHRHHQQHICCALWHFVCSSGGVWCTHKTNLKTPLLYGRRQHSRRRPYHITEKRLSNGLNVNLFAFRP